MDENSSSSLVNSERGLGAGGSDAYVTVNAEECVTVVENKKIDDSDMSPIKKDLQSVKPLKDPSSASASAVVSTVAVPDTVALSKVAGTVEKPRVQTGIDRYINVVKRKRSPNSSKVASNPKMSKDAEGGKPNTTNRFALLQNDEKTDTPEVTKSFKPPPIYLRERDSVELVKALVSLIGKGSFFLVPIKRGNICETKIQVNTESDYRKVVSEFEASEKSFYTYQLKSSKGLQVVIKGIGAHVDTQDVKSDLEDKGFKIKNVTNIRNREKAPQPVFRVELEPGDVKLKKGETHPIYDLKHVFHYGVVVEVPHKRSGPVQCFNCQEFGHTRAYCKLPSVCVACGELHSSSSCTKIRTDPGSKKCSNCGGNHTANYRGCSAYSKAKRPVTPGNKASATRAKDHRSTESSQNLQPTTGNISYANALRTSQVPVSVRDNTEYSQNLQPTAGNASYANVLKTNQVPARGSLSKGVVLKKNQVPAKGSLSKGVLPKTKKVTVQNQLPIEDVSAEPENLFPPSNSSRLEATLDFLAHSILETNNMMRDYVAHSILEMKDMMREMLEMQRTLMQAILNKP